MKSLVFLAILVGMLSCQDQPSAGARIAGGEIPPGANAESGGTPNVTIQQADVNEDGEINVLDLTAVSHYMGQKVPKDPTWLFSSDEITIGEHFWVRVDLPGETGEQMDFELRGMGDCGNLLDAYTDTPMNGDEEGTIQGRVGGLETFIILNGTGQSPSISCSLHATATKRTDGSEIGTFSKSIKLRSARITMSNVDWSDFLNSGIIRSATVSVDDRTDSPIKEYVKFSACRALGKNRCEPIGNTAFVELPDDGVLKSLQLMHHETKSTVKNLLDGKYLLIATYDQKGKGTRVAFQVEELLH